MATSCVAVTLDTSTKPATVQVDEADLDPGCEPQTIKWQLVGNARAADFVSFRILETQLPANIFGPFAPIPGTQWATLSVLHTGSTTRGPCYYELIISLNGMEYSTPPLPTRKRPKGKGKPRTTGTGGTPNIKNN